MIANDIQNEHFDSDLNRMPPMRSKKSVNMRYNDEISEVGYGKYVPVYPPVDTSRRNAYEGLD